MSGVLEITTRIGCKINCKYCPQNLLVQQYFQKQRPEIMSFQTFQKCIDKVPHEVMIDFAGMSEPWLNPECTKMVEYAADRGHKISIFSTLVGMHKEDIAVLKQLDIEQFVIHIPDQNQNSKIEVTEEYLELLKEVQYFENVKMMHYSCHGQVDERVVPIIREEFTIASDMIDRAGNLQIEGVTHQMRIGERKCLLTGDNLNSNILLPDGSVLLCCMDYGMRHILGNLLSQSYQELFYSKTLQSVRKALQGDKEDILCTNCSNALSFNEMTRLYLTKNEENIALWKAQKWFQCQLNNYRAEEKLQKQYINELLQGKDWLEEQYQRQKQYIDEILQGTEQLEEQSQDQKKYIEELLQGKDWLEEQYQSQKQYIDEILTGKDWLERQYQNSIQVNSENEKEIGMLKSENAILEQNRLELKNEISKLNYKLNQLTNDKLIQKIIKMKKYQI